MFQSFHAAVAAARGQGDWYFAALLPQDRILKAFGTARAAWQGWVYTPAVTVGVFLSQCLSPDHSCREAVARHIAWRLARGLCPCSAATGAYCTAHGDLTEAALHTLVRDTGKQVEEIAQILVIFSLSVGTVSEASPGEYQRQADWRKHSVPQTPRYADGRRHQPARSLRACV